MGLRELELHELITPGAAFPVGRRGHERSLGIGRRSIGSSVSNPPVRSVSGGSLEVEGEAPDECETGSDV